MFDLKKVTTTFLTVTSLILQPALLRAEESTPQDRQAVEAKVKAALYGALVDRLQIEAEKAGLEALRESLAHADDYNPASTQEAVGSAVFGLGGYLAYKAWASVAAKNNLAVPVFYSLFAVAGLATGTSIFVDGKYEEFMARKTYVMEMEDLISKQETEIQNLTAKNQETFEIIKQIVKEKSLDIGAITKQALEENKKSTLAVNKLRHQIEQLTNSQALNNAKAGIASKAFLTTLAATAAVAYKAGKPGFQKIFEKDMKVGFAVLGIASLPTLTTGAWMAKNLKEVSNDGEAIATAKAEMKVFQDQINDNLGQLVQSVFPTTDK